MSDDGKCYAATFTDTLEEHILNPKIVKSEPEWWARAEITCLRADLAAVTAERDRMQYRLAAVTAERDRMQYRLDAAYNVIDKDIKNDMAFAKKHADLWLENERLREALKETLAIALRNEAGDYVDRARAALEGVTETTK